MLKSRRTLGLSITPQAITAVEASPSRAGPRIERAAEMRLASPGAIGEPEALGKALGEMLRSGGFSASHCVIGLDAAWLAAREKRLPQAAAESLTDILRIAAEQDFASEGQDLLVDFVPRTPGGSSALLTAARRQIVDQLVAAANAAGLTVEAVTSSALTLAAATAISPGTTGRIVLCLAPGSAELVVEAGGAPRVLRRLSPRSAPVGLESRQRYVAELEADLRRGLALSAALTPGTAPSQPHAPTLAPVKTASAGLLVWNGVGLEDSDLIEMGARLGAALRVCTFAGDLANLSDPPPGSCASPAPAAALALALAGEVKLPLDFLHSRLTPKKKARFGKVVIASASAAVGVIAAIVWLVVYWQTSLAEIDFMNSTLQAQATTLIEANAFITKTTFARKWYDTRPKFMECLRELALSFPNRDIWATKLNVGDDMHVLLSGVAADEQIILNLESALRRDPRLAAVETVSTTPNGRGTTREVSFTISFTFAGAG